MTGEISIDLRMLTASGIGTYLRNLVPLVISASQEMKFNLLCHEIDVESFDWLQNERVNVIQCDSSIYSINEQIELIRKIPKSTTLFWSPHYNIPLYYGGKLLVTVHDVFHLAMPEYVAGIHKKIYAAFMFQQVQRKAESIIYVSKFTHNEYLRLVNHRSSMNTNVIYNGIDHSWYNVDRGENPHGHAYILYVGNVKPHKNIVGLLRAFTIIKDQVDFDLVIVGKKDGFLTGDARAFIEADNLKDRVNFTGHVDEHLLKQYYKNALAMVFPSFYEGFGLPPLEAMACECPVIVSDSASLPEICGEAAIYCDPSKPEDIANKILMLSSDAKLGNMVREKGLKHAKQFTWDKCAQQTVEVIEEVLSR